MPHLKLSENVERPSWEVLARSILNPFIPQNKTIMLSRLQKALEEKKSKDAQAALKRKKKRMAGLNQSSSSESDENEQKNPSLLNPSNINKSNKVWWGNSSQKQKQDVQAQKQPPPKTAHKNISILKKKVKQPKKSGE